MIDSYPRELLVQPDNTGNPIDFRVVYLEKGVMRVDPAEFRCGRRSVRQQQYVKRTGPFTQNHTITATDRGPVHRDDDIILPVE